MPVRDGMLQIIERVRELIGDESGVQFVNQRIQDVLDENARGDAWYLELRGQGTIMPGGTVRYYDFYAPVCPWDESASLYNGEYTALTGTLAPGTADYMRGYFNFAGSASPPYGPVRPVRITGSYYDIHLGASVLLEQWAGSVKAHVSFKDPNYSFEMQEQYNHLRELAAYYRSLSPAVTIKMYRSDN